MGPHLFSNGRSEKCPQDRASWARRDAQIVRLRMAKYLWAVHAGYEAGSGLPPEDGLAGAAERPEATRGQTLRTGG